MWFSEETGHLLVIIYGLLLALTGTFAFFAGQPHRIWYSFYIFATPLITTFGIYSGLKERMQQRK